jgi:hypothetical protein
MKHLCLNLSAFIVSDIVSKYLCTTLSGKPLIIFKKLIVLMGHLLIYLQRFLVLKFDYFNLVSQLEIHNRKRRNMEDNLQGKVSETRAETRAMTEKLSHVILCQVT